MYVYILNIGLSTLFRSNLPETWNNIENLLPMNGLFIGNIAEVEYKRNGLEMDKVYPVELLTKETSRTQEVSYFVLVQS